MKRLIYQVYVGQASNLYDNCVESVSKYCAKHNIDHIVQSQPIMRIRPNPFTNNRSMEAVERLGYLPIYEKENAFDYLDKYDEIAIIDSDIYIRPNSPNIFENYDSSCAFSAVVERTMPITEQYVQKIRNYSHMQYSTLHPKINFDPHHIFGYEFMNMGMIVINKNLVPYLNGMDARTFITQPKFQPFIDGLGAWRWSTDQTLLNTWIRDEKMKIGRMSWVWNGLYSVNTKLHEAHFVHFFLKDKLPNKGENWIELLGTI